MSCQLNAPLYTFSNSFMKQGTDGGLVLDQKLLLITNLGGKISTTSELAEEAERQKEELSSEATRNCAGTKYDS